MHENIPTRELFIGFSPLAKAAFYLLTAAVFALCGWFIYQRYRLWRKGRPVSWATKPTPARVGFMFSQVFGQRKVPRRRKYAGPMHLGIFYGFVALTIGTILLGINEYSPVKFHQGTYYLVYEFTLDVLGLALVIGVTMALARRWFARPKSVGHTVFDTPFLLILLGAGVTGYLGEAARLQLTQVPEQWARWSVVANAIKPMFAGITNTGYQVMWWVHMAFVFAFFVAVVRGRMLHLTLIPFTALGQPERKMGELQKITMEEVEETGKIGAVEVGDYSRWHLMSTDACMECGRCTDVCPAHAVGKVLNPKRIVQDLKGLMETNGRTVAEALNPEALMECTTCHACVKECPALIRHVDIIVDARRAMVAEGMLSGSAATMLRQLTSTENPWGLANSEREAWMAGLEVPLARDKKEFEVLFWVGCAGAFDRRAQSTTKAVAQLLNQAGVDYACLGNEERCNGDPARRAGDEFLYQQLAETNVGTFKNYRFKKIITPCPHCFNTLKNEYHQFGGVFEVQHHTQFLADMVAEGKLKAAEGDDSLTFHDPCYLARVNKEGEAPRKLVNLPIKEVAERKDKTFCCGAGGARMWMEEPINQRPGIKRAKDLLATGAKTVGVACPFCKIMVGDSIAQTTQEEINIVDMAELMLKNQKPLPAETPAQTD